jgi:uncharacterized protein YozE (UPF0346 family)
VIKTFKLWLIDKYLKKDTPRGDLAYGINRDKKFPEVNDYEKLLAYISFRSRHNAVIINVFKRCWCSYKKEVLKNARKQN